MSNRRRLAAHQVNHHTRRPIWMRPKFEKLELRRLLASDLQLEYEQPAAAWYARVNTETDLNEWEIDFLGPRHFERHDWIVRLSPEATQTLSSIDRATALLDQENIRFEVVAGLGLPGLLHVRTLSLSAGDVELSLATNSRVAYFSANEQVSGQIFPDDPEFGSMTNLHNVGQFGATSDADIDAPEAWDTKLGNSSAVGSPSVVVGVIDSGVDPTHPDLYLNIWLNQGEIPTAKRLSVIDTDNDGLITFYDLDNALNASQVRDLNANGYIDAIDLLDDPLWADGRDTDGNGFTDDFFGWNFRTDSNETFAPNNPSDVLGHGTHVAGTIGAIGNNGRGVTGINWRSSIMALKFLDENNQGDTASAIAAVNYATMMRTQFNTNVRVLNNSWGQPGGSNTALKNTIEASGNAGILFVAAAGNGNILGQGVDNDRTLFYPASYELDNIIAVGASDDSDRLAGFSNYGVRGVDIVAPGVGVLSTLPGGRYGEANGTSMATPHVSGAAALVWSSQSSATVSELKQSLLNFGDVVPSLGLVIGSGRRLNVSESLKADIFAPTSKLVTAPNIVSVGGTDTEIQILYSAANANSIAQSTIDNGDIEVYPLSFESEPLVGVFEIGSLQVLNGGKQVRATYRVPAVGGTWDLLDTGIYEVRSKSDAVRSSNGLGLREQVLGRFEVRIAPSSNLFYVDTRLDTKDANPGDGKCEDAALACSLRAAIQESNASPLQETIVLLNEGTFSLGIAPLWSNTPSFPLPTTESLQFAGVLATGMQWNGVSSGDLDVQGRLKIIGSGWNKTIIDGSSIDRIFKVYPGASLDLRRVTIQRGNASDGVIGGAILNAGELTVTESTLTNSEAFEGSAIASVSGRLKLNKVNVENNGAKSSLFISDGVETSITQSSVVRNRGGGIRVINGLNTTIENTTIAANVQYSVLNDNSRNYGAISSPSTSADGRFTVFATHSQLNLQDTDDVSDVYLYDRENDSYEWISRKNDNLPSESPVISADGNHIAFISLSSAFASTITGWREVFVYDRQGGTIERVTDEQGDIPGRNLKNKFEVAISPSGREIAFISQMSNGNLSVFMKDLVTKALVQVSGNAEFVTDLPSLLWSGDGRYLVFTETFGVIKMLDKLSGMPPIQVSTNSLDTPSNRPNQLYSVNFDGSEVLFGSTATNLHSQSSNGKHNLFLKKISDKTIELVTKGQNSEPANGDTLTGRLSGNGKRIAFVSQATNIAGGQPSSTGLLYILERETGQIAVHPLSLSGAPLQIRDFATDTTGQFIAISSPSNIEPFGTMLPTIAGGFFLYNSSSQTQSFPMGNSGNRIDLTHVTLATGGVGEATPDGPTRLTNSIVVSNFVFSSDVLKPILVQGSNVIGPSLSLGPLKRSGNGTWFQAIARNSAAWDTAAQAFELAFDQLGNRRGSHSYRLGNKADVGAVEMMTSTVSGVLYREFDGKSGINTGECGLPNVEVFLDMNGDGKWNPIEPRTTTRPDNPATLTVNETGEYQFENVPVGEYRIIPELADDWKRVSLLSSPTIAYKLGGSRPYVSGSGRFVAFASTSSEIVDGDTNQKSDIFVFDRETNVNELISVSSSNVQADGDSFLPMLSDDGRFVVFESESTNLGLHPASTSSKHVYLRDRLTKTTTVLSMNSLADYSNGRSILPAIDPAGTTVVFSSNATNLSTIPTFGFYQVYAYDIATATLQLASKNASGIAGDGNSFDPTVSNNGSRIVFASSSTNLDAQGNPARNEQIYLADQLERKIYSISREITVFNRASAPTISGSGDFIVFQSDIFYFRRDEVGRFAPNWFYDVSTSQLKKTASSPLRHPSLSTSGKYLTGLNGSQLENLYFEDIFSTIDPVKEILTVGRPNENLGEAFTSRVSRDGDVVVFDSTYSALLSGDRNQMNDVYVLDFAGARPGKPLSVLAGESYFSQLPYSPVPRSISGKLYVDGNENGLFDGIDLPLQHWDVFVDLNRNGQRDLQEPARTTDNAGNFSFSGFESELAYSVVAIPQPGYRQSSPAGGTPFEVFLTAHADAKDRDFGFMVDSQNGQFENSTLSGKLFNDVNGDRAFQNGEPPLAGVTVYLDLNGNEVRDFDEPRAVSDSTGSYSFSGLGDRLYTVRILLSSGTNQTSPLGNRFATTSYPLTSGSNLLANPQDVIADDFNGDLSTDLAVALQSGNSIAIRLNDKSGGFGGTPLFVPVGPGGIGPVALASGKLNPGNANDIVTANLDNSTATILLDFNGTDFASKQTLDAGITPTDVVLGMFDADADFDAIVTNQSSNQLTLLVNNGSGSFTKGLSISSGGKSPASLVTGLFNDDALLDIAVANYGVHREGVNCSNVAMGSDCGNVAVLLGHGDGTFGTAVTYRVGVGPFSIATGDVNGDGLEDLVTANLQDNTASLLLGAANGSFSVASEQLNTGSEPLQIGLYDIELDGDKDILVTNLKSQSISILRNRMSEGRNGFEPAESFGLGKDSITPFLAFTVADFDNSKTPDIAVVNNQGNLLKIMRTTLVNGAHRVRLNGIDNVADVNFGTRPELLFPRMNPIDNPEVLVEDARKQSVALSGIAPGRTGGPALRITASSSNTSIIPTPNIDYVAGATKGELSFTPTDDASGQVVITVMTRDAGVDKLLDTVDDAVLSRVFTVSIRPVNDAPTFELPTSRSVTAQEDSGARTVSGFITNITTGGGTYESSQKLDEFLVATDNLGLFSVKPMIDAAGTLRFTSAPNAVGTATVTVTLKDDGDTAFGGTNLKTDQFVLTIHPVNDAPTINVGGKQTVLIGAATQTVSGFATGFLPGGGTDEDSQVIAGFAISVDKPELFSVLPTIDKAGTLRYTPSTTRTGMARVSVQVRDDGGSNTGGIDLSVLKTFDIEVAPLPDTLAPTPVLSSLTSSTTNASPIDLTVDFGEAVTGFTLSDLVLSNATATSLVDLGAGKFTVAISATVDGAVAVSLPAAAAKDLANNNSLASASFTRTVDRSAPVATITTSEPNPTTKQVFTIAINFGEAVQGFELSDLVVGNATAANLNEIAPGRYSVTITAVNDGVVFVGFSAGIARDPASNLNTAPTPLLISVNSGATTFKPLIFTTEPLITGNRNFTATVDFGRAVTGFDVDDVALTNATATVTDLGAGKYRLSLEAVGEGQLTVGLPANKVLDASNRSNTAADPMSLTYVDVTNSDFGDAPTSAQSGLAASYPTSLTDNAARHKIASLFLGSRVDAEANGQATVDALGDNQAGTSDDEEGVRFPLSLIVNPTTATTSSVNVIVSQAAKLDGWIDFNRDGDWLDAGEQILSSVAVVAGSNMLVFTLSAGAASGNSYARFRVSTAGGLSAGGPALDGEVEDYRVDLLPSSASTALRIQAAEMGDHEVTTIAGQLVVRRNALTLFSTPLDGVGSVQIVDSSGGILTELKQPQTNLSGTLKWIGNRSTWMVSSASLGLSTLVPSLAVGVHTLDLTSTVEQTVQFQLSTIQTINATKSLRIELGSKDVLQADSNWKYASVAVEGDQFVPRFTQSDASLEIRSLSAWQNPLNHFDINGDAAVSPLDALLVINELNNRVLSTTGGFKPPSAVPSSSFRFLDTDGNGAATPLDVLLIINRLNERGSGEGESVATLPEDAANLSPQPYAAYDFAIAQLAYEEELRRKRLGKI